MPHAFSLISGINAEQARAAPLRSPDGHENLLNGGDEQLFTCQRRSGRYRPGHSDPVKRLPAVAGICMGITALDNVRIKDDILRFSHRPLGGFTGRISSSGMLPFMTPFSWEWSLIFRLPV